MIEEYQYLTSPSDQQPIRPQAGTTAAALLAAREEILDTWQARVQARVESARRLSAPVIINTLPAFLNNLIETLCPGHQRKRIDDHSSIALEHGGERARVTKYAPDELILEYKILKEVLFEVIGKKTRVSPEDERVIRDSVDSTMSASLHAYFETLMAIREQFTLTLTHDLRTPLSAIMTSADLLARSPQDPEKLARLAERIVKSVKRIDRMIQDLLDAAQIRAGERLHLSLAPVELYQITKETLDQLSAAHKRKIALEGDQAITGFWNADALKRALENLVVNAIKHGEPEGAIRVLLKTERERATVSVHNEGPAIPIEDLALLFEPFHRPKASKEKQGWGLGLALIRGVAEAHGGSVIVDSAPGRGTTFTMDIPLDPRKVPTFSASDDAER